MRRREFVTLLGGAVAALPIAVRAQQPAMPVVGFLHPSSPEPFGHIVNGFRRGLSDSGFVEGQNVVIEFRWARGEYDRLPALAAELVQRGARVILAGGVRSRCVRSTVNHLTLEQRKTCDPFFANLNATQRGSKCAHGWWEWPLW